MTTAAPAPEGPPEGIGAPSDTTRPRPCPPELPELRDCDSPRLCRASSQFIKGTRGGGRVGGQQSQWQYRHKTGSEPTIRVDTRRKREEGEWNAEGRKNIQCMRMERDRDRWRETETCCNAILLQLASKITMGHSYHGPRLSRLSISCLFSIFQHGVFIQVSMCWLPVAGAVV